MRRLMISTVIVLIVALVGGAGYLGFRGAQVKDTVALQAPPTVPVTRGDVQQTVIAPGQLVGTREMVLGMEVGGQLAEINVRPGDTVRVGDGLARLDPMPLEQALALARLKLAQAEAERERQLAEAQLAVQTAEARLAQAHTRFPALAASKAALAAAQAELRQLLEGPDEGELIPARAELASAEAAVRQAQAAYDQMSWRSDMATQRQAVELERATNTHAAAKARVDILLRGASAASIASAQARVKQAQGEVDRVLAEQSASGQEVAILEVEIESAHIALQRLQAGMDPLLVWEMDDAEKDLAAATMEAPFDGVVLKVMATPGETVSPGTEVILLADPAAVEVRTTVIEEDLPLVQIGQPVDVFFDARPDAAVQGRVARIVPQRISGEDRPLYHVYVALVRVPEGIVAGMTADASIAIAQRSDVLRLPRALVRARSDGRAQVKVWTNGLAEDRTIRVGLRGDVYVEVLEGLREGERVVGE
jgi:HlyD family secretion protein